MTNLPRRGTFTTKPRSCSCWSASRMGIRLTPKSRASLLSLSLSPALILPQRIVDLSKSATCSLSVRVSMPCGPKLPLESLLRGGPPWLLGWAVCYVLHHSLSTPNGGRVVGRHSVVPEADSIF